MFKYEWTFVLPPDIKGLIVEVKESSVFCIFRNFMLSWPTHRGPHSNYPVLLIATDSL